MISGKKKLWIKLSKESWTRESSLKHTTFQKYSFNFRHVVVRREMLVTINFK